MPRSATGGPHDHQAVTLVIGREASTEVEAPILSDARAVYRHLGSESGIDLFCVDWVPKAFGRNLCLRPALPLTWSEVSAATRFRAATLVAN
jgi:hypothetical protein